MEHHSMYHTLIQIKIYKTYQIILEITNYYINLFIMKGNNNIVMKKDLSEDMKI